MGLVLLKCQLICAVQNGPKIAGCAPFWGGRAVSPSNTKSPKPGPTSVPSGILIHPTIWPQQMWAKNWGDCAPLGRGAGSPSNTMWPGPRPTCIPSFHLDPSNRLATIHERHRQDRQTGQVNGSIR